MFELDMSAVDKLFDYDDYRRFLQDYFAHVQANYCLSSLDCVYGSVDGLHLCEIPDGN